MALRRCRAITAQPSQRTDLLCPPHSHPDSFDPHFVRAACPRIMSTEIRARLFRVLFLADTDDGCGQITTLESSLESGKWHKSQWPRPAPAGPRRGHPGAGQDTLDLPCRSHPLDFLCLGAGSALLTALPEQPERPLRTGQAPAQLYLVPTGLVTDSLKT